MFVFDGVVKKGQYAFPFAFRLPVLMAGSFYHDVGNYIEYKLIAELTHTSDAKKNQTY